MVSTMIGFEMDIEMLRPESGKISSFKGVLVSGRGLYRRIDARFSGSAVCSMYWLHSMYQRTLLADQPCRSRYRLLG